MGDELARRGIEPLEITSFIEELNHSPGINLASDITEIESLVDALCHLP